jgi:hypothetical protein
MPLTIRRKKGETWRECVERYASKYGGEAMKVEVLADFDRRVAGGVEASEAAIGVCHDYDLCDLTEDGE